MQPRRVLRVNERERDWQKYVIDLARTLGWRVAHFRPAQTQTGRWVTPVAADGAGFPDLVLVRDRVVFAELKTNTGKVAPQQVLWRDAIIAAGGEHHVWRPRDADAVQHVLKRNA
jgi:hypothetical protein